MGFKKLVITHPNTTIWQMTATRLNAALITALTLNTATLAGCGAKAALCRNIRARQAKNF